MLVFEGPDNSGKSTIASYISYQLDIPVYHFGAPPRTAGELRSRITEMFKVRHDFIFDRIPLISEPVYSLIKDIPLSEYITEEDFEQLRSIRPIIVYCRPPDYVVLEKDCRNLKAHDEPDYLERIENNKRLLLNRYDEVMGLPVLPHHLNYDYTKQEHDLLLIELRKKLIECGHYKHFNLKKGR